MSWTSERARVASLSRSRTPDDPELISARDRLKAARRELYIEKVLSEAPTLTPAQRDEIAMLLRGGDAA